MSNVFVESLDLILGTRDRREATRRPAPQEPDRDAHTVVERRREWFARFAEERVMPRLEEAVAAAKHHGVAARCRLSRRNGGLVAELVITSPRLPAKAQRRV